jgi:opacity protein-like surface antigen
MKKTLLISLAFIGLTSQAHAFSGDEGRYYLSAHIGYANQKNKQTFSGTISDSSSKASSGLMQSAAVGYYLSNDFRTDISLIFMEKLKSKKTSRYNSYSYLIKGDNTHYGAFLNGYYDIFSGTVVMPYFMGGFGMMKSDFKSSLKGNPTANASKGKTKMAYQLGAGVDVHMGVGWTMDMTYRIYNQLGKRRYNLALDSSSSVNVNARTQMVNVGMIGLRKTF